MYKNFSYISKTHTRLDALISSSLGISKNKAGKYCDNGLISVNRRIRKSGYSVKEKSEITIKEKIKDLIPGSLSSSSSCLLYTSPSPRDATLSRMPSSA